jgi:hypothetical protein
MDTNYTRKRGREGVSQTAQPEKKLKGPVRSSQRSRAAPQSQSSQVCICMYVYGYICIYVYMYVY